MSGFLPAAYSETEWLKTKDGCEHFLRVWRAENAWSCLLYLHGIEGHSLWFAETAAKLSRQGITVYTTDRRGAGESREERGDIADWKVLVDDVEQLICHIGERHDNIPLFLMGNCWGAKLASITAASRPQAKSRLQGLVFSSPALSVKVDLSFSEKLLVAWRFFTGNLSRIAIPLSAEHFTNNPKYLAFIKDDPLRLQEASPRFFVHGQILGFLAERLATAIDLPTMILQSGEDDIVDVAGLKRWFARLKSQDKSLKIYPNAKHSLDFDANAEEYRTELVTWLQSRTKNKRIVEEPSRR